MNSVPFYVTLPSDASMDQYPGNNAADWTTKLKNPLNLPGRWEVALVEMQYVNSLSNLPTEQRMIIKTMAGIKGDFEDPQKEVVPFFIDHVITFPPGHYGSASDFLTEIRKNIPDLHRMYFYKTSDLVTQENFLDEKWTSQASWLDEMAHHVKKKTFEVEMFSATDHRLRITLGSPRVHIHFPPDSILLQKILGFDHSDVYARMNTSANLEHVKDIALMYQNHIGPTFEMVPVVAPRPLNPRLGNQSLFVYCDIADYSLVGDTAAQVLRSVPIKGEFMELITERFDIPHYVPILTTHFETVTINISTDLEEIARFATGKSLIKLHFRPLRRY